MVRSFNDYVRLQELTKEKNDLDKELEKALERWIYLNEKAEIIEKEKVQS